MAAVAKADKMRWHGGSRGGGRDAAAGMEEDELRRAWSVTGDAAWGRRRSEWRRSGMQPHWPSDGRSNRVGTGSIRGMGQQASLELGRWHRGGGERRCTGRRQVAARGRWEVVGHGPTKWGLRAEPPGLGAVGGDLGASWG